MHISKWKKQCEKATPNRISAIWHSGKDKTRETLKKIQWLVLGKGSGREVNRQKRFLGQWNTLWY